MEVHIFALFEFHTAGTTNLLCSSGGGGLCHLHASTTVMTQLLPDCYTVDAQGAWCWWQVSMLAAKGLTWLARMQVTPGVVSPVYSDREFDHVLKKHADQLVVVCASSTDCKPCRSFEPVFDVGSFFLYYSDPLSHLSVCLAASCMAWHGEGACLEQGGFPRPVQCSLKRVSCLTGQADAEPHQ